MKDVTVQEKERRIQIYFNEEPIMVPKETWTGKELMSFLMTQTNYMFTWLYKDLPDKIVDTLIRPSVTVVVKDGDRFYDLPPAIKG